MSSVGWLWLVCCGGVSTSVSMALDDGDRVVDVRDAMAWLICSTAEVIIVLSDIISVLIDSSSVAKSELVIVALGDVKEH